MNRFIKNYEILGPLGEGGMGTVFRAMDTELHREVALKCLRPEIANNPGVLERFRNEALAQAQLNHPNIAHLYAFFQAGAEYFMAMEYINGATLSRILHERRALPCDEAAGYAVQALRGLEHAHTHVPSIFHRDIKPANLMINGEGQLKVTDFGIARVSGANRATRAGMIVGTYEYISPEAAQGQPTTALSDVYSMGVVLYEMIAGRLPFESTNEYELLKMHIQAPRPSVRSIVRDAPGALDDAIRRAMDPVPRRRFVSAGEMAEELESCLETIRKQTSPKKSWLGSLLGNPARERTPDPIPAAADRRRADISNTCHRIEDLLELCLWDEAGSALSAGLRAYPAEPDLMDLGNRLQRQRQQYELGVGQQAELVRDLLQRGLPEAAMKAATSALAAFPGAPVLLDLQHECRLRTDAPTEGGELVQAQQRIEALIGAGKYQEAMDYLMELPGSNRNEGDLGKLLARIHRARKVDTLIAEARELERSVSLQAARDRLLTDFDSLGRDPGMLAELRRLDGALESARRETAIRAALTDAAVLRSDQRYQEAIELLDRSAVKEGADPRLAELRAAIAEDLRVLQLEAARREAAIRGALAGAAALRNARKYQESIDLLDRTAVQEGPDPRLAELRAATADDLRVRQSEAARRETAMQTALADAAALRSAHRYQESIDLLDRCAAKEGPDARLAELRAAVVEELHGQQSPVTGMAAEVERLVAAGEGNKADLLLILCRRQYPDHPEFIRLQPKVDAARDAEWERNSREAKLKRAAAAIQAKLAAAQVTEAATALEEMEKEFGPGAAGGLVQKVASAVAERQRRAEEERDRSMDAAFRQLGSEAQRTRQETSNPPAARSTDPTLVESAAPGGQPRVSFSGRAQAPTGEAGAQPPMARPRADAPVVTAPAIAVRAPRSQPAPKRGSKRGIALIGAGLAAAALVVGWVTLRPGQTSPPPTPPPPVENPVPIPTKPTDSASDALRNSVRDAIQAKAWSKAAPLIEEMLANNPTDTEAQEFRKALSAGRAAEAAPAERLFKQGDYAAAIEAFRRVLNLDPGNTFARSGLKRAIDAQCAEDSVFGGGQNCPSQKE